MKRALKFGVYVPYSQAIIAPNVVGKVFSYQKQALKTMYRKTSSHGAQAVMGQETNVQMKNAQKHCTYQCFLLGHLRPDALPMLSSQLFVQTRSA